MAGASPESAPLVTAGVFAVVVAASNLLPLKVDISGCHYRQLHQGMKRRAEVNPRGAPHDRPLPRSGDGWTEPAGNRALQPTESSRGAVADSVFKVEVQRVATL